MATQEFNRAAATMKSVETSYANFQLETVESSKRPFPVNLKDAEILTTSLHLVTARQADEHG
jgi:hypothetical protein